MLFVTGDTLSPDAHTFLKYNQWKQAWQVQHLQHTSARRLAEVGPYLLSDVGCPANLKDDLHAIRRELRQSCADVSVH